MDLIVVERDCSCGRHVVTSSPLRKRRLEIGDDDQQVKVAPRSMCCEVRTSSRRNAFLHKLKIYM